MEHIFQITGMDCTICAMTLEKGVGQLDGVQTCELDFAAGTMRVVGDVERDKIVARVRELGYDVLERTPAGEQNDTNQPTGFLRFLMQHRDSQLAIVGAILIVPGFLAGEILGIRHVLVDVTSVAALLVAGMPVFRSALRSIVISRDININVLMTIASIGAALIGVYTEAGMVIVLFAIGEALESYTTDRARQSIRSLMELAPVDAKLLEKQGDRTRERRVGVDTLELGDVILVKPGERIPMDGRIVAGSSLVNQAPITGESRLVEKEVGSTVLAGSINGEGSLQVEVTHLAADNTISRLIQLVEEGRDRRAPTQRFVDRFARYYTPAVVCLAVLVAVVPPLLFGQPFLNPGKETLGWLYRGLALLVVGCPCALVISTPVSIISAISNATHHGVLIKGGAVIEALSDTRAIAFDKTGTLTRGRPSVIAVRSVDHQPGEAEDPGNGWCVACDDLLALAASVERHSEHPVAHAVVSEATRYGLQDKYPPAETVTAMPGRGVTGVVSQRLVTIASHQYFSANKIAHSSQHCALAAEDAQLGHTPLMIAVDGDYVGTITVADTLRPSSREAMAMLTRQGLNRLVMLSGDNPATAEAVAEQVGVTDVRAELLPEDKVAAVRELQLQFGKVAMVGDGINDAPALAAADVGIAIGGAAGGTAQAMETADITLMSDDLRQLPFTFKLSRSASRTIKTNVAFTLAIKLIFLTLVTLGLGTMWMAVAADMGTSLLVTLNGMRLLRNPSGAVNED